MSGRDDLPGVDWRWVEWLFGFSDYRDAGVAAGMFPAQTDQRVSKAESDRPDGQSTEALSGAGRGDFQKHPLAARSR